MSKLLEALKRAEELRKQRLAMEAEAAALRTRESALPEAEREAALHHNNIEQALIAEEVKMTAQRIHDLYEEDRRRRGIAIPPTQAQPDIERTEAAAADGEMAQPLAKIVAAREAAEQMAHKAAADYEAEKQAGLTQREAAEAAEAALQQAAEKRRQADEAAARELAVRRAADADLEQAVIKRIEEETAAESMAQQRINAEKEAARVAREKTEAELAIARAAEVRQQEEKNLRQEILARIVSERALVEAAKRREQEEMQAAHQTTEKLEAETRLRLAAEQRLAEEMHFAPAHGPRDAVAETVQTANTPHAETPHLVDTAVVDTVHQVVIDNDESPAMPPRTGTSWTMVLGVGVAMLAGGYLLGTQYAARPLPASPSSPPRPAQPLSVPVVAPASAQLGEPFPLKLEHRLLTPAERGTVKR